MLQHCSYFLLNLNILLTNSILYDIIQVESEVVKMIYGYCRVSTKSQNPAKQAYSILTKYPDATIFSEVASGTDKQRKYFTKLLKQLHKGDMLVFESADRISRNGEYGKSICSILIDRGVRIESLNENSISDIFTVFDYAELELKKLKERQKIGIAIAKEQGKFKGGQVERIDDKTFTEAYERYQRRELTKTQLAAELKISRPTLDKYLKSKGLM